MSVNVLKTLPFDKKTWALLESNQLFSECSYADVKHVLSETRNPTVTIARYGFGDPIISENCVLHPIQDPDGEQQTPLSDDTENLLFLVLRGTVEIHQRGNVANGSCPLLIVPETRFFGETEIAFHRRERRDYKANATSGFRTIEIANSLSDIKLQRLVRGDLTLETDDLEGDDFTGYGFAKEFTKNSLGDDESYMATIAILSREILVALSKCANVARNILFVRSQRDATVPPHAGEGQVRKKPNAHFHERTLPKFLTGDYPLLVPIQTYAGYEHWYFELHKLVLTAAITFSNSVLKGLPLQIYVPQPESMYSGELPSHSCALSTTILHVFSGNSVRVTGRRLLNRDDGKASKFKVMRMYRCPQMPTAQQLQAMLVKMGFSARFGAGMSMDATRWETRWKQLNRARKDPAGIKWHSDLWLIQ